MARATHTLMSGKRDDLVDLGIVELHGARTLRSDDRQRDPSAGLLSSHLEDLLDAAQDQGFGGPSLTRSACLQSTVDGVGDVDSRSHEGHCAIFMVVALLVATRFSGSEGVQECPGGNAS